MWISKLAVDGFEPAILRWQAGMHPQDHKPGLSQRVSTYGARTTLLYGRPMLQ